MNPGNKKDNKSMDNWERLKDFLRWYQEKHGFPKDDNPTERYCLALSVEDILTVMKKIEDDNFDEKKQ